MSSFAGIKLIIYDMDGTLADTFEDIWYGLNTVFSQYGLPSVDYETVKRNVGEGADRLVERSLPEGAKDQTDEIHRAYRAYYASHPAQSAKLYPGVIETLGRMRGEGIKQAILTNKPEEIATAVAERLGLIQYVEGVWGEKPGEPRKPDAEAVWRIVRHCNLETDTTVLVGDGRADREAAQAAGVKFIGVNWGQSTRETLAALKPDGLLDRIEDLPGLLG